MPLFASEEDRIPLPDCQPGTVYRVASRNLRAAVYTGERGAFIGIREKFGDRYLFAEYHWDSSPTLGTLSPLEAIGTVPDGVELTEREPTRCGGCEQPASFDRPVAQGGRGWVHADDTPMCADATPYGSTNRALFAVLERFEATLERS